MVLKVFAHSGAVRDDINAERLQLGGRSDSRKLKELRRIDRAAAYYHLAPRPDEMISPAAAIMDSDGATPLEADFAAERLGHDGQIGALHRRPQIGVGGG